MKKLIAFVLICLLFVPAFAEEAAPECIDLFPYIGSGTRDEIKSVITEPFIRGDVVTGGSNLYYGESLADCICFRYAREDHGETYGWGDGTVYYVSLSTGGYSLMGIGVDDTTEDIAAICLADGWMEMAEAPQNCDGGYEKTAGGVKYTLGYIIEYGTSQINLVYIEAIKTA